MSKANKDGWIRHRGGKCPVEAAVMVDVRYRGATPGVDGYSPNGKKAGQYHWRHDSGRGDIMAYRIHKPEECVEPVIVTIGDHIAASTSVSAEFPFSIRSVAAPLEWRDRIREIDRTVEALEGERVSLIQRLEDEGLQLFQGKVCGSARPAEDMSDWRNWKEGDLVEVLLSERSGLVVGVKYPIKALERPDYGGECPALLSGGQTWLDLEHMRWHSRPST